MNKTLLSSIIGVLVIVGLIVGIVMYMQSQTPTPSTPSGAPGSGITTNNDAIQEGKIAVEIKNFSFMPNKLTIKKGSTITWTNQDTTKHNVVAANAGRTGGLPTEAPLLAKDESVSHTFNEIGTFTYKCAPHPNMTGTVEVVD